MSNNIKKSKTPTPVFDTSISQTGELIIYGKGMMYKYLNNHLLNTKLIKDKWYFTGDIVDLVNNRVTFKGRREYIKKVNQGIKHEYF